MVTTKLHSANLALILAHFSRWTLRKKPTQRRLPLCQKAMRTASLILFASCLFGCETPALSPSFPVASQVSRIFISGKKIVIEQSKIAELFTHLGQIEGEWSYTAHTYPTPQAQITFAGASGQALCRLDIGPSWVGSDCGVELKSNWPPLVTISREQALFFRDFVAGTWEVK